MYYPERQSAKSAHILKRRSTTQGHACCNTVGISATHIHSTITAKTHSQHIYTSSVASITALHPIEHIHYLLRAPCSARVLRNYSKRINLATFDYGIERTISAHSLKIATAKACAMQEYDDGSLLLRVEIIYRSINPEVVTTWYRVFYCTQKIVSRSLHC